MDKSRGINLVKELTTQAVAMRESSTRAEGVDHGHKRGVFNSSKGHVGSKRHPGNSQVDLVLLTTGGMDNSQRGLAGFFGGWSRHHAKVGAVCTVAPDTGSTGWEFIPTKLAEVPFVAIDIPLAPEVGRGHTVETLDLAG